jgi:hypothetical protein
MKAAAGDLGALLTELSTVPWKFEGLTYSTEDVAAACQATPRADAWGHLEGTLGAAGAHCQTCACLDLGASTIDERAIFRRAIFRRASLLHSGCSA